MKERGVLFIALMVHAMLADLKSQTRRIVKPQFERVPVDVIDGVPSWDCPTNYGGEVQMNTDFGKPCPLGVPGDRLWARETFFAFGRWETRFNIKKGRDEWHFVDMTIEAGRAYLFTAPADYVKAHHKRGSVTPTWWRRPAIFMPRVASRITLEITEVRVERLQTISARDAMAEGCEPLLPDPACSQVCPEDYVAGYQKLWDSINGDGAWAANPFVWIVCFRRIAS